MIDSMSAHRARTLVLAALAALSLACLTACGSTAEATAEDDTPAAAANTPAPEASADPATAGASAEAQHDARMAAASASTGPVGGEATKTGTTPQDSKLTDQDGLDINAVLKARRGELTGCYDEPLSIVELPADGFLIKAKFTIEADGRVSGAEIVEVTESYPDAEKCFLMKLASTTFPAPPEGRVIETSYPFKIKRKLAQ